MLASSILGEVEVTESGKEVVLDKQEFDRLLKMAKYKKQEAWENMLEIVRRAECCYKEDVLGQLPEEVIRSALLECYYGLMWDKMADRTELREKLDRFIMVCRGLVVHAQASKLAEEAFVSICDLMVMFGQGEEQMQLRPIEMAVELLGYLEEQIFSEQEEDDIKEQEEKLGRKR